MIRRDLVGYAESPPDPRWPGGAKIAVNFNLNVEGGGELTLANGDETSEGMLNDIGVPAKRGVRVPLVESAFEYGSRRGVWRVLDIFGSFGVPISVLGVVRALEQNPGLARAFVARGHEVVSHGYRWIDYCEVPEAVEREHIRLAVEKLTELTGERPLGWMTGRPGPNTRRLHVEAGGFLYDRDSLADELPYWLETEAGPHLVVPYSFETNDNRFNENTGFSTAQHFFEYMRDAFDLLYREGERGAPKLLSIALHDRLIGRPARAAGLVRLLEHMRRHEGVWFCRGIDIARHWRAEHPAERAA
ncbi:chitin deacetylase [Rhizobiales bacterium L72]|uniref:Chitooligosaccharide deacetylase n=2 Tax=Propylenella binzhouense TaxID=2555902 RepID=A0A964WUZ1_9HYPH|nr:polysaccharide deacetylase family protein [Propylenella binzhouense]MYZ49642.1 chitin deacetylase [Propylenella binzhouense]